jgi:hypothetical protein
VQKVREAASRIACANNLKQIGLAALNYESSNGGLPWRCQNWVPYRGWGPIILSNIEQEPLAKIYNYNLNFWDPANAAAVAVPVKTFTCPSSP